MDVPEYHKINSIFKRDEKTKQFTREYALPEFEYLRNNTWIWTEKVDGTNVRVHWNPSTKEVWIGGRTKDASMPIFLMDKLRAMFTPELMAEKYPDLEMILYGEGYGARIQKGGGNYIPDGNGFTLFDININGHWLERHNVEDIGQKLILRVVPVVGEGTLLAGIDYVKSKPKSKWGDFTMEGIVLRPKVELKDRRASRIITKVKVRDFNETSGFQGTW